MSGFPPAVPPPGQRFVRLRHPDSPGGAVTTTFIASPPSSSATGVGAGAVVRPDPTKHPVVIELARHEPARAARVAEGLGHLLAHENEVLTWLEADPAHAAQFARDPKGALREALPGLPEGFFDGWRATKA